MSTALVEFLRTGEGDLGGNRDDDADLSEEEEGGEKLRFDIFNDNYTEIEPDREALEETLPDESWVFPAIYKTGAHGDTLKYQIGYNHISKKLLWTVGRVETGGVSLFSLDVTPTRAQKGSFQKKALTDALNKYELKMKNGFHRELYGRSTLAIPLPMLAHKYRPPSEGSEGNVPHLPVAAQPKFDGERHIVFIDSKSGEVRQMTRQMNPRLHFQHIREEAGRLLEFLPPGSILDGELYSNLVGFQAITSIAGSKVERHPRERDLDYYVFDVYHPDTVWRPGISAQVRAGEGDRQEDKVYARASGYTVENYTTEAREYYELPHDDLGGEKSLRCVPFDELLVDSPMWVVEVRVMLLMNAFRCFRLKYGHFPIHIKLVKTFILHGRDDIQKLFLEMRKLDIGGPEKLEGIMLRHLSRGDSDPAKSLYRPGRSDNLLKVKGLHSTEVLITGVKAGRGRAKDLAILMYKEPGTGITGTVVPAASHEERRAMLLNPNSVKGRTMTVSFQNRMTSGAMRFPVGLGFVN